MPDFKLSKAALAEFIAIWAEEFDEILTEEKAEIEARRLLHLFWVLSHPLPGEETPPTENESQTQGRE